MYTVQIIIGIIKGVQKKNILLLVFTIQATMIENKMICIQLLFIDILQKSIISNPLFEIKLIPQGNTSLYGSNIQLAHHYANG